MPFLDDPAEMTPEQRLAEIVAILLAGARLLTEKRLDLSAECTAPCAS